MKILGRIVIILVAFALVMGITYLAVKAGSSSAASTAPVSARGRGTRSDFHRQSGERGGGWMFGMIRNVGIIAIIVALITVPKGIRQKRIRNLSANAG